MSLKLSSFDGIAFTKDLVDKGFDEAKANEIAIALTETLKLSELNLPSREDVAEIIQTNDRSNFVEEKIGECLNEIIILREFLMKLDENISCLVICRVQSIVRSIYASIIINTIYYMILIYLIYRFIYFV